jgi:polysaccharide pyruvyl transferase WcaK-like protein
MQSLLGQVDLVVGMRLHALIMAVSMGVPAVGVVYDPKVQHLCNQWELPAIPSVESLEDATALLTRIRTVWAERASRRERLHDLQTIWRARSAENFTLLRALLPGAIAQVQKSLAGNEGKHR